VLPEAEALIAGPQGLAWLQSGCMPDGGTLTVGSDNPADPPWFAGDLWRAIGLQLHGTVPQQQCARGLRMLPQPMMKIRAAQT
jgi:hypothetical protein